MPSALATVSTATVPTTDIDPFSEAYFANPFPRHAELRGLGPAFKLTRYDVWGMARYAQVTAALNDWKTYISGAGAGIQDLRKGGSWRPPSILLEADPPLHDQTRGVMGRILSAPAVRKLRVPFETEAARLVDELVARGTFDAVADLAIPYPLKVIGDAVGVPVEGREALLPYSNMLFNAFGPDNAIFKASIAEAGKVVPIIMAQCERAVLTPGSFGARIWEAADAGKITNEQAHILVRSLLSAGFDTTVHGLSAAFWGFALFPEQWDKVRGRPELQKTAFDEVLRWESPAQTFFRTTSRAVEVADGIRIPEGAKVLLFLGAANRDPEKWPTPERLDVTRNAYGHVALGMGIHVCVGQMIAKLEAEALLTAFASRVARFELAGEPVRRPNNTLRGFASLPLRVVPA